MWRKLPIRSQDNLWEWKYDDHDNLEGLIQCAPPSFQMVFIPIEKAIHFKTKSRKGNPEGRSVLRNAYRSWYFKRRIGAVKKKRLTADDERVCEICGAINGETRNMSVLFSIGKMYPPAHPSCRCAVAYEEIEDTNITPTAPIHNDTEQAAQGAQQPDLSFTVDAHGNVMENEVLKAKSFNEIFKRC
ncbi:hypothetical protein FACS189490_08000 [Clostridia bacterium]|nr:hypothetical protein FACS189490_08000 [Clostridia bacterium]